MKELDVLLEAFLEQQCKALENGAWPEFESLLQMEDNELWDWIQQPDRAEAAAFNDVLKLIRNGR